MKKHKITVLFIVLIIIISLSACMSAGDGETTAEFTTEPLQTTQPTTVQPATAQPATVQPTTAQPTTIPEPTKPPFDPYETDNEYDISPDWFKLHDGTDYGTLIENVEYYSTTADDYKRCNVLLPPGYSNKKKYPVLYMIHGWGADYTAHVFDGSYLHMLYGNLLREKRCEPMIIVGVDEERLSTAVAGVSEGGARSLCTGFKRPEKFGYIASIAPDGNAVVMTENYMNSYWTVPYFENGFPVPSDENKPKYVYLAVGSKDPWNISFTAQYSDIFSGMGVANQHDYVEGYGHDSEFWGVCMYNFLQKIFK